MKFEPMIYSYKYISMEKIKGDKKCKPALFKINIVSLKKVEIYHFN